MDQIETNPFDQSPKHQELGFESLRRDPARVKEVVNWYNQVYSRMIEECSDSGDFGLSPVASRNGFPGRISLSSIELGIPRTLSNKVTVALNINPTLLIDSPQVPLLPIEHSDDPLMKRSLGSGRSPEKIADERRQLLREGKPEAEKLRLLLGLDDAEASYDDLAKISSIMTMVAEQLDDALYFRYLLDQAADSIKKIAPSLTSQVDGVLNRTLLLHTLSSNGNLYFIKVGELFGISVGKGPYKKYLDDSHGFRVSVMGHELLHAVLFNELKIPGYEPGYADRLRVGTMSDKEKEIFDKMSAANLGIVILEGTSLAFEHQFIKTLEEQTNDRTLLNKLEEFSRNRLSWIREQRMLMSPAYKEKVDEYTDDINPADVVQLNYYEGVKLAIALKRNGWTLNDLPELIEEIKQVVEEEVGTRDGGKLLQIGVSIDKNSPYKKIIGRIRRLSPSVK